MPHNGFHDLLNGHADFEQWLGQVDSRRAVITVPCKQRQKWPYEKHCWTVMKPQRDFKRRIFDQSASEHTTVY
jgi:hypothetical protein